MRIVCDLAINVQNESSKSCRSTLTIGSTKSGAVEMVACSQRDKNGIKTKLYQNVSKVFDRFIEDGKATIQTIEPQKMFLISKAPPIQLRAFLKMVNAANRGLGIDKKNDSENDNVLVTKLSTKTKNLSTLLKKPEKHLIVTKKADYPFTAGFARTLESLTIQQCQLDRFDSRWLKLKHLTTLAISNNGRVFTKQVELFPQIGTELPQLRNLNLSNNNFGDDLPAGIWDGLPKKLIVLDISGNGLLTFPDFVCLKLKFLKSLNLARNRLKMLPHEVGFMVDLKELNVAENELSVLPGCFSKMKFNSIDMTHNPWKSGTEQEMSFRGIPLQQFDDVEDEERLLWNGPGMEVVPLRELAGKVIIDKSLPINILPEPVCDYLSFFLPCSICRGACLPSTSATFRTKWTIRNFAATVSHLHGELRNGLVVLEGPLCSTKCLKHFKLKPL